MWVVTTDLDVHLTAPVTVGPLRVDVDLLRAGATTAVTAFSLHDEGAGRAGGRRHCDRSAVPVRVRSVGARDPHRSGVPGGRTTAALVGGDPIATRLGFRIGEDGSVEVDLAAWLRNPWGILHGGVTACLIDLAGEVAGSAALGRGVRVTSEMVRYLAPAKVGPVRGVPRVLAVDDGPCAGRGAGRRRGRRRPGRRRRLGHRHRHLTQAERRDLSPDAPVRPRGRGSAVGRRRFGGRVGQAAVGGPGGRWDFGRGGVGCGGCHRRGWSR